MHCFLQCKNKETVVTNMSLRVDISCDTVKINEKLSLGVSAKQWKPTWVKPKHCSDSNYCRGQLESSCNHYFFPFLLCLLGNNQPYLARGFGPFCFNIRNFRNKNPLFHQVLRKMRLTIKSTSNLGNHQ